MTEQKSALVVDPTLQALQTGFLVGQAGYEVFIRRSASRAIEEIVALGCSYDLVIIIDTMSHDHSPGIRLLEYLRYEAIFEGLIVFYGDPHSCGRARAIGGTGFEWAASIERLEALVKAAQLITN